MTIMLGKVYAALKAAGASEAEAQAAAEEVGDLREEFAGLRSEFRDGFGGLRSDVAKEFGDLRADMGGVRSEIAYMRGRFDVLIWAVGINAAATIAILGVLLRH